MDHTLLSRSTWTSTPRPVAKLVALSAPAGFALHYTGSTQAFGNAATLAQSCARLEDERRMHVDEKKWSDIAYLGAVDQAGRLFDCRGVAYRSAANGDAEVNARYGALTWLGGVGDVPTPAAVEAIRWWRGHVWLAAHPHATAIVGHRDLYSTECPGDPAYRLVTTGALTRPTPQPEDDVALTSSEIEAVAIRTRDAILAVTYGDSTFGKVIGEIRTNAIKAATGVDVDALAAAIVGKLPAGAVDVATLAGATADELAKRLVR